MDPRIRALNRFGLGARVGEARTLSNPRGWLLDQLAADPPRLDGPGLLSADAIGEAVRAARMPLRASAADQRAARQRLTEIARSEEAAVARERVTSERPFVERLVSFWANHLAVSSAGKFLVAPMAGWYEREAIRPHVLGRFSDMVLASATHPAMLVYLDNFQSVGPASAGAVMGARAGNRRGLNENYARELLELHTLGVDGGYSEQDVLELARVLTGWGVSGLAPTPVRGRIAAPAPDFGFAFDPRLHEPGPKTVLSVRYPAGREAGERAIRALCAHPSTAAFVARKLVTHFVADDPPEGAVARIASAFLETGGDLRAVSAALVELPEPWLESSRKFRSPQDWVVAVFRSVQPLTDPRSRGRAVPVSDGLPMLLRRLRQPLWGPPSPAGYGDAAADWADPDSLLNRAELARTLATRMAGLRPDPLGLLEVVDPAPSDPLRALLADTSIPLAERLALAFASPAFQWR